jgi:hypothetical protein
MHQPPKEIDGARVVCFAVVTPGVEPTGAATHRRGGQILGPARALAICQYTGESSFYLFYCGEDWTVHTDTFHLSLEGAKHQAEFEYEGISGFWQKMG